jgi:hypothetical protein
MHTHSLDTLPMSVRSDKQISWITFPRTFSLCELADFLTYLAIINFVCITYTFSYTYRNKLTYLSRWPMGEPMYIVLSLLYVNPPSALTLISYTIQRPQLFPRRAFVSFAFFFFGGIPFAGIRIFQSTKEKKGEALPCKFPRQFP